jgi:DNA-directed RNA polymerase specialized sigma24 family protein
MNTELIELLYRRHYKYLFMVAYNICRKWDMSEDIVQDGFIRILTSKEEFLSWQGARQYLCACIRNAAFDRLGREKRIKAVVRDFVEPGCSPLETVTINLFKLKSAMSRVILDEIYFHGRTRREVAKEYRMSREVVRGKEVAALKELSYIIQL